MKREFKVGIVILAAVAVFAAGVFLLGGRSNLFTRKNSYSVRFEAVLGLAADNPVQLNGVTVGKVQKVVLPESVEEKLLKVWVTIDRRFEQRVRQDSVARIKTLGLLGDKYIEVVSGSPGAAVIPSGGEIPAAPPTDVDRLIATGEDMVDNIVAISSSMRSILTRMEAGEGLLGDLLRESEHGKMARDSILGTIDSVRNISRQLESGQGTLGALISDRALADRIEHLVDRFESLAVGLEEGEGTVAALLYDPALRAKVEESFTGLSEAAREMSVFAAELREGTGLVNKLLHDDEYADSVTQNLEALLRNLQEISAKLERGDGTLGQMINDPALYHAMDDVVVGIDESRFLRWLIRNRQKKGIKKRYDEAQEESTEPTEPVGTEFSGTAEVGDPSKAAGGDSVP
ncbi:MAG: MlaD family protein [Acidobacteriota bacterium]|nr:MlaD family protein [Acidobacteriota bacterium]